MSALNVVDGGNPSGEPMLLIHGFMSSRHQWAPNLERLGAWFRTIRIELPGHGDSPPPGDASGFTPPVLLGAIDEVRDRLGLDRWWVVGHSLGGAVGIRYGLAHPERTLGLVFTNSRAVFGIGRSEGGQAAPPMQPTSRDDLRRLPYHPIHAKRFPADLQERMVEVADAMDLSVFANLSASGGAWRSSDELHQLTRPVLLVNGSWESAFQPHVDDARRSIPDLRVVDLEGGHSINIEQPEAFDWAVIDFIAERSDTAPS